MDAISRRLLFQIGTIRFCVSLEDLVEIRDQVVEALDCQLRDLTTSIVGSYSFRKTLIPVVDLAPRLELSALTPGAALILNGAEGNWALLVDQVDGFFAVSEMTDFKLSHLLQREGWRCFDQISLHRGSPYICLDLAECYPGGLI